MPFKSKHEPMADKESRSTAAGQNKTRQRTPFLKSLQDYLKRKKDLKQQRNEERKKKQQEQKTVRVSKKAGMSLLMNKYVKLARSGQVRGAKDSAKEATANSTVGQKTDDSLNLLPLDEKELGLDLPAAEKKPSNEQPAPIEKLEEVKVEDKKVPASKADDKIFDKVKGSAIDESIFGSTEEGAMAFPEDVITDEELAQYIEIPEALLEEAKELEVMAKDISKEELEDMADFLGVFKGGAATSMEQFSDYAAIDPADLADMKPAKKSKTKKSEKQEIVKGKHKMEKKKVEKATKTGKKSKTKSAKSGGPSIGLGAFAQLKQLLSQQRKLLESVGSIAKMPVFNRKNAKKLKKLMEAAEKGDIVVQPKGKKSKSKKGKAVAEELVAAQVAQVADQSGATPRVGGAISSAPPVRETGKAAKKGKEAGDPTKVKGGDLVSSGAALAEEDQAIATNTLGMEILDEDEQEDRRKNLEKQAKAIEKEMKNRALPKESIKKLKEEGLGIDLEGTSKKKKHKKVDVGELREDLEQEDFLESTAPAQEGIKPNVKAVKLSKNQKKALELQRKKQEKMEIKRQSQMAKKKKMEEKRWGEEAKRREQLLKKREDERKKREKQMKKGRQDIKIKIPKKQAKQGGIKAALSSLNYMGMGKERVGFISNLGTMMDAGLPLLDALRSLEMEAKNKQMKKLMNRIITAIELGSPLWRAMEAQYFFQPQQCAMVKVGEEAGNLTENLKYLTEQSEKDESLRSKVKTAMIYPVIIFVMLTAIIMGLGIFVLPNLIQVIYSLGVPLPFVTRMIIKFTNLFENHSMTIIPGFFGGSILLVILTKYTSFKVIVQWFMFKIPGIGALLREATLSRFGVIMGGLLSAGLPVTDALDSVANVTPMVKYRKFYYELLEHIRLGDSFRTSFKLIKLSDKCFPTSVQQLVITGEQSGSLTRIMQKIAEIHDKKATNIAEKLPVILEPMLLLFIGSLVGTIALGILAPIYSIVGNVG